MKSINKLTLTQTKQQTTVCNLHSDIKSFETGFAYFPDYTGSYEHYIWLVLVANIIKTLTDWLIAGHYSPKMTMG